MKAFQIKVAGKYITENGKPLQFDVCNPRTAECACDVIASLDEFMSEEDQHSDIELVLVKDNEEETIAVRHWNESRGTHDGWYRSEPYQYRLDRGLPL